MTGYTQVISSRNLGARGWPPFFCFLDFFLIRRFIDFNSVPKIIWAACFVHAFCYQDMLTFLLELLNTRLPFVSALD